MHRIQEKLLALSKTRDLSRIPLRSIAEMIEESGRSPSVIQHHFDQLDQNGLLFIDRKNKTQRHGDGYLRVSVMPNGRKVAFIPFNNYKVVDIDGQLALVEAHTPEYILPGFKDTYEQLDKLKIS